MAMPTLMNARSRSLALPAPTGVMWQPTRSGRLPACSGLTRHTLLTYGGGEEWKDALSQAKTIMADPQVEAVFIGLGANNVCAPQGHDYTDDLTTIAGYVDATLTYLTDTLPAGGRIYWSGVLDISQLRELMRKRDHNYWFETCQGAWDLDANKIKDGAANDVCDHFLDHTTCSLPALSRKPRTS